mmetsp:Transcript_28913/g.26259  ORF Transcript_28913/g.26259 Transcript_28913/m.26259 type:complete len:208 (-) Transcript_28913:759-1382(-)
MDMNIDLNNYEHPDNYHLGSNWINIGTGYHKNYVVYLQHNELKSDTGWLLQDEETRNFVSVNEIIDQLDLKPRSSFLGFTIRVGTHKEHYIRRYIKLQDVFSEVDGLVTLAIILIAIFVFPYVKLRFYQDLVNDMFDLRIYRNSGGGPNGVVSLTHNDMNKKKPAKTRPSLAGLNKGLRDKTKKEGGLDTKRDTNRQTTDRDLLSKR